MVFTSNIFLYVFFPAFLAVYFLFPAKFRNVILLIFSLIFYAYGEGINTLVLIFSPDFQYFIQLSFLEITI